MARPVCKRFLQERPVDQSASTYPASETCSLPRWRYARSGPHKIIGVQRRVFLQDSRPPFDCHCQAILWSTSRKPIRPSSPERLGRSILTQPRAILWPRILSHAARLPRQCGRAYWRAPRPPHWDEPCRPGSYPTSQSGVLLGEMRHADRAPWISSLRIYLSPRLVMPRSLALPPVENCRGTRPSQAERSRPCANASALPTAATRADAVVGANAGNRRQPPGVFALPCGPDELRVERYDTPI